MDWDTWEEPVVVAATAIAAAVAARALGWIIDRTGRRHGLEALSIMHRAAARPWVATVAAVATLISMAGHGIDHGWRQAAVIAVIGSVSWLIVAALRGLETIVAARMPIDVADNRAARRARTQLSLARRILAAVVLVIGTAAVLMTFPGLRTFGASILASAGLAGIIAGLAAQTTLGNVFSGIQLAFTDALRVDDVVVVEGEWGKVEEITLTYVVIHIWDERRLVLPTCYFTTTPFQNWTRHQSRVLGSVLLHVDFRTPLEEMRATAGRIIHDSPLWDRRDWVLQVTDTTPSTMVVRVLASAPDAAKAWDLRCEIREKLLLWLNTEHPEGLPTRRAVIGSPEEAAGPVIDEDEFEADFQSVG